MRDHVEGEVVLVGSAGAEALHLRVDDARIDGVHHVVAEPQPLDGAGREILHHDIGAFRHVLDEIEPTLGFEVDGDGFLIGVEQQEIPGVLVRALAGAGLPAQQGAARFAALRVFDLDDLGTEPGECLRAGWAGLELGQVQNTDAGKKGRKPTVCSHFLVLPLSGIGCARWWMSWTLIGAFGIRSNQLPTIFNQCAMAEAGGGLRSRRPSA